MAGGAHAAVIDPGTLPVAVVGESEVSQDGVRFPQHEIAVDKEGAYHLDLGNGKSQPDALESIVDKVAKILREKPDTPVLVRGDRDVNYGAVVALMAQLQGAGVKGVGLVTEPPSGPR